MGLDLVLPATAHPPSVSYGAAVAVLFQRVDRRVQAPGFRQLQAARHFCIGVEGEWQAVQRQARGCVRLQVLLADIGGSVKVRVFNTCLPDMHRRLQTLVLAVRRIERICRPHVTPNRSQLQVCVAVKMVDRNTELATTINTCIALYYRTFCAVAVSELNLASGIRHAYTSAGNCRPSRPLSAS